MSTENQLDQYLKDPLSMPEDIDLDALGVDGKIVQKEPAQPSTEGDSTGAAPSTTEDDPDKAKPAEEAGTATTEAAKPAKEEGAEGLEPDPDKAVVKSKDGKHEIPYSVLAKEREDRIRAERMAQELTEQVELLKQAKATGESVKTRDLSEIVDAELLAQMEEESPTVAKTLKALMSTITELDEELGRVKPLAAQSERESQIQHQVSVEDAISTIPKLLHIRTADPAAFNEVADYDQFLRAQPKWQGKPMQERFEAAVRLYEAANGEIELPNARKAPASQSADTTQAKVDAAIKAAEAQAQGPHTLSDIPGGVPAASTHEDALTELSSMALTERFLHMSPEQIEAELARLS